MRRLLAEKRCLNYGERLTQNPHIQYETQLPKDWTYILNDSECAALFCSTDEIFSKAVKEVVPNTPSVLSTLCFDTPAGEPHSLLTALENAEGQATSVIEPTPEDLAGAFSSIIAFREHN